jgi:hypothetical protein
MMVTLELSREQQRLVALQVIAEQLITNKQYLDETGIAKYKYMINEFGTLMEIDHIAVRFNNAWPTDVRYSE